MRSHKNAQATCGVVTILTIQSELIEATPQWETKLLELSILLSYCFLLYQICTEASLSVDATM